MENRWRYYPLSYQVLLTKKNELVTEFAKVNEEWQASDEDRKLEAKLNGVRTRIKSMEQDIDKLTSIFKTFDFKRLQEMLTKDCKCTKNGGECKCTSCDCKQ